MTNKWFVANIKPDRNAGDVHPRFTGTTLDPWIIFHVTEKIFLQANVANVVLLPPLLAFSSRSLTSFCYLPRLLCSLIACIFVRFLFFLLFLTASELSLPQFSFVFLPSSLPYVSSSFVYLPTDVLF